MRRPSQEGFSPGYGFLSLVGPWALANASEILHYLTACGTGVKFSMLWLIKETHLYMVALKTEQLTVVNVDENNETKGK